MWGTGRVICFVALSALYQLFIMLDPSPASAQWRPTRPIELVVMAGEGGGADQVARLVAQLIIKHRLAPVEVKISNVPGRDGGDALALMKSRTGDDHVLLFTLNSFFTVPLSQPELGIDILKFAPLARLGLDPFLLWVHTNRTDIKSADDFIAAVQKVDDWTMAGTGSMSEDELLTIFLNHFYKLSMNYRPEQGGGAVARLLADGVVDSTVNNPGEIHAYHMAGRAKPLAAFTKNRLRQYPDIPTFWELGLKLEYLMQRSVAGPPNMSDQASRFYTALFTKLFATEDWRSYRNRFGLVGDFATGVSLREYWRAELELHRRMLGIATILKAQTGKK